MSYTASGFLKCYLETDKHTSKSDIILVILVIVSKY